MSEVFDSVYDCFADSARRYADRPFLAVPERLARDWDMARDRDVARDRGVAGDRDIPTEITYREALDRILALADDYAAAGYGVGDVVALAIDSRPQHVFHYLALNRLGACSVPVNTDLIASEIAYVLGHSRAAGVMSLPEMAGTIRAALDQTGNPASLAIHTPRDLKAPGVGHRRLACPMAPRERPAAILYTSGTTGHPKGCVLSNLYALLSGQNYGGRRGALEVRAGEERILNPLPLYHMNALTMTLGGVISRGACFILPGRFSLSHWWADVRTTRATRIHYLGIMIPALLSRPAEEADRMHDVRVGVGAGVDPIAHRRFEDRFAIPLHEVWGMTETGRGLAVSEEPRQIDTRACGRPPEGFLARILREDGTEAADDEPGELVVRAAGDDPRHGFFTGYLDDPEATAKAWEGDWFHTGDICARSADGMFFFVDRRKNIVRRSGENISSAEVEAVLAESPLVAQAAVMGVPDAMRDEEVLACIVLTAGTAADEDTALSLMAHVNARLAYYKTPGWFHFVNDLPTTGTQKTQKHRIFPAGFDPSTPGLIDLRHLKKRRAVTA